MPKKVVTSMAASEMSDGELALNSEKTEDEIKNQKGKTPTIK